MKHPSTRALFDYWNRQRGLRPAPARSDIDPADIRHVLGDTLMLAADFIDEVRFRLAGTRVCALFAREIKGEAFNSLWTEGGRTQIEKLLDSVIHENAGIVAGLVGRTEDSDEVKLELLLLPLAHAGEGRIRALGVLAPLPPPYWLGERPVIELELYTLRHIETDRADTGDPGFGRVQEGQRKRHGLLVYSGGRDLPPDKRAG
jgi:hypothetical protein